MINPFTHRRILRKGRPGRAEIVAMSHRDGGATTQNVAMTLQVMVEGMSPYEVEDQWMVHHKIALGFGMSLPVKVDEEKPEKVAIDWDAVRDEQAMETASRRAALASQGPVGAGDAEAIQNPFAAAGMAGGFGALGGSGADAAEPSLDLRNDPELREKLERVLGRELVPGTTERLDFSDDPQMAAAVMGVIAQHQAEKQMGVLGAESPGGAEDTIAQIERLDALRQSGALTQEEFNEQKRRLLGS